MSDLDEYRRFAECAKVCTERGESMEAGDAARLAMYAQAPLEEIERLTAKREDLLTYWRGRYNDLTDSITAALDGKPVDTSDLRDYPLSVGAKKAIERIQAKTTDASIDPLR